MKLVIDISKYDREWIMNGYEIPQEINVDIARAIIEGEPLQPEKLYTKADYIMALHKEYGCSFTRAEEAHNKALEYLQDEMMMKG